MDRPIILDEPSRLPVGGHALSMFASDQEGADHAASFLSGGKEPASSSFWVGEASAFEVYQRAVERSAPRFVESLHALKGAHVEWVGTDRRALRPIPEVLQFLQEHPQGLSAGANTLSHFWSPTDMPAFLEYENWIQQLPHAEARLLCPYDLRRIPVASAPTVVSTLARRHDHLVLSRTQDPLLTMLELFLFRKEAEVPPSLRPALERGLEDRWVQSAPEGGFEWTARGEHFVEALARSKRWR
ncbi:MAG: hypothetical protein KGJ23_07420 [Euryarchaeota archaeon]|nr:hypothetical protein [Euryarchaeota archaeon]MDE1836428.1 hypothetical protein [Euryarchaeota archaeon]MDE1879057.1 hypothetical protein [Euryarchaeota archaeon]MDE2044176.1 hypothetical protein [Thermoplasmata archaeon]